MLVRSLKAVAVGPEGVTNSFDRAIVALPAEQQADWLLDLFKNLTQEELDSLPALHKDMVQVSKGTKAGP